MLIKVVDTPDDLFEYDADIPPRKDEFINYNDQMYKVSYVSHFIDETPETGKLAEVYTVVEVSMSQSFLGKQLR